MQSDRLPSIRKPKLNARPLPKPSTVSLWIPATRTEIKQHRAGKQESPKTTELLAWLSKSPTPYPMALNQQQRGIYAHKTHLDSHEPAQSPTYDHRQDFKVPEQQIFHYQDQQHLRLLSQPGNPYLAQDHVQSTLQSKTTCLTMLVSPNTPVFTSPKEDQSGFNFPRRREDLCSPLYQTRAQGSVKLFHRWLWGRSFSSSHSTCSSVGTGTVFLIWLLHYRLICI